MERGIKDCDRPVMAGTITLKCGKEKHFIHSEGKLHFRQWSGPKPSLGYEISNSSHDDGAALSALVATPMSYILVPNKNVPKRICSPAPVLEISNSSHDDGEALSALVATPMSYILVPKRTCSSAFSLPTEGRDPLVDLVGCFDISQKLSAKISRDNHIVLAF